MLLSIKNLRGPGIRCNGVTSPFAVNVKSSRRKTCVKFARLPGRYIVTSAPSDDADLRVELRRCEARPQESSGSRGTILTLLNALCQFKVQGC